MRVRVRSWARGSPCPGRQTRAGGRKGMIRPILAGDVQAFGGTFPVFVHAIDHPSGVVLVDTGPEDDDTVREWVDVDGATSVEHDGEAEVLELGLPTWLAHVERPHVARPN